MVVYSEYYKYSKKKALPSTNIMKSTYKNV